MIRATVWFLLAAFVIGGAGCNAAPPPTAGATPAPPSQVWILQPQEGANLLVHHSHVIQVQGASFFGIDYFQVKISEAGIQWQVTPQSTGSGGAEYGTMFFAQKTWTPQVEGDFTLSVRAFNASGSSPWAMVHVTVIDMSKATHTPTPLPGFDTSFGTKATWTPTQFIHYASVARNANCRTGPGTAYNKIGFVARGDTVEIVGRNEAGTWLEVVNPHGEGTCWVSGVAFESQFDMNPLPILLTPTLPPPPPPPAHHGGSGESKPKGCTVTDPTTGQTSCVSPCPAGAVPGKGCEK